MKIFLKLKDEKGQNLVEFALIVGLLLAIVFGIVEFGRAWYRADVLKNAANTAARTYAVSTAGQRLTMDVSGLTVNGINVTFTPMTSAVRARAAEYFQSVVPLVPALGGNIAIFGNHTISRDATYRLEQ